MAGKDRRSQHDPDTFEEQQRLFNGMISVSIKASLAIAALLLIMMWTLT